jgi:hypothetical protein
MESIEELFGAPIFMFFNSFALAKVLAKGKAFARDFCKRE